jgi:hypothetical protein
VFLDCPSCDDQYIRTQITLVNYVRDRADADGHVLVTTQGTGGGGTEYALKFIGLGRFQDVDNSLTYSASQVATADEPEASLGEGGDNQAVDRMLSYVLWSSVSSCVSTYCPCASSCSPPACPPRRC